MNNSKLLFILITSLLLSSCVLAQTKNDTQDLDVLYDTLKANHPKLSLIKPAATFDSLYKVLRPRFSKYTRIQKLLEMTKLVASLHDGHSKVGINFDTAGRFHVLPVGLYIYSDGVFVRRISEKYSAFNGMKVLKIGDFSIEDVIKKMSPYLHGENEYANKDVLPSRLINAELLNYIGAVKSITEIPFLLEDSAGKQHTAGFIPVPMSANLSLVSARDNHQPPPLYLQGLNKKYWFKYIDSLQVFYFQFNAVQDMPEVSFKRFVDSMFVKIAAVPVQKMIIDIRLNNGGDNTILQPLIHQLIRCDKVNQKGKLFTIIGRLTFSAAVNLTAELEKNTETIFVGEPTAAGPNHFGETKSLILPVTGMTVLYSSAYWQNGLPWDKRTAIEPSVFVKFTSRDFRNNVDPCLNAILAYKK